MTALSWGKLLRTGRLYHCTEQLSRGKAVSRARETKISLPCSQDQKQELARRAQEQELSVTNYLRSLLGWPLERQGSRKDLTIEAKREGSDD